MKKIIAIVCTLLIALVATANAADTSVKATGAPVVVQSSVVKSDGFYNGKEWGISLGTGYVIDKAASFKEAYSMNLTAGAFWFPYEILGVEANVPFYETTGTSVKEVQAGAILRVPLSTKVRVLKCFAPYVGIGGVYNWDTQAEWAYIGKLGLEFRTNSKWGFFVEGQFRNNTYDVWHQGQNSVQGGIKLVF